LQESSVFAGRDPRPAGGAANAIFRKDDAQARLAVLSHFDVKGIHFRKLLGRNNDQLTILTGIFDENGNFVTGLSKVVDMNLLETTYARLSRSGFTV